MPEVDIYSVLAVFFAIGVIYIVGSLLVLPIKIVMRLIVNGIIGAIVLFLLNVFGSFFNIGIAINPVTALIAGFLGVPGIILLYILRYIF